jgi:phospholipid N-methyltransferase
LVNSARFLASFICRPIATGAIVPSSRYLARRMVEDMALGEASTVVELGPGTGAFTGSIQALLKPEALFLAVELNEGFAAVLREQFPTVGIINESAEKLSSILAARGRTHADSVLCSLPWAAFPRDLQERLIKAIVEALRPGGRFCTFAYTHASLLPAARRFRELLNANFASVKPSRTVWRNLPPAFVYRCEKR